MKIWKAKNEISQKYHRSLYKTLDICLSKLQKEDLQDKARIFIGYFLNIGFNRISKFKQLVMGLLTKDDDLLPPEYLQKIKEIEE
jgi:hypothetical protein